MRGLALGGTPLPPGCRCLWSARRPLLARRFTCALQQADGKVVHIDGSGACITYRRAVDVLPAQIEDLLDKVGWPAEHRGALQAALQNSFFIGSLRVKEEAGEERLVGLVRVVSDGAFNAQLWDALIDPEYQGLELDKSLVKEVTRELVGMGVSNITALASKSGWREYEKIGFQASPDGVTSMCWRGLKSAGQ